MPNTEVKLSSAEDTCELPCWENRTSPDFFYFLKGYIKIMNTNKQVLIDNIDKIHTTELGVNRIKKNLNLTAIENVVEYCKNKIMDENCNIYMKGKNWYCEIDNIRITVNSYSYTIITAHIQK